MAENMDGQQSAEQSSSLGYQVKAPILETLGISKAYKVGEQVISPVNDVTLQVGANEFVIIFGPSGAGKTTLINILMGLEEPDIGEVFLKAASLYQYTEEQRTVIRKKRISYLPSTQYWLENMNVLDNTALPLIIQGVKAKEARKKAMELLRQVGLEDHAKSKPVDLSSGQQQKVSLARALMKDPWVIFADEPTAHLDTNSAQEVMRLLLESTQKLQAALIMVTHNLEYLKQADRWLFMRDGRLRDIKDRENPLSDIKEILSNMDALEEEGAF